MQNAEFDEFNSQKSTIEWAHGKGLLESPDRWLLSKLQEKIEEYTQRLETCQFNAAVAVLEDFVIEILSRLYVPMVRKELWTDDAETLNRRLAVYATLWHVLKTVTLLFNPITPYLSEALYQRVFRKLDPSLLETVNLESWPMPQEKMRNKTLEENFETLFQCVSLTYAARQSAKLKRRWPLSKVVLVADEKVRSALEEVEDLFLELANVKESEYVQKVPKYTAAGEWVSVSEGNLQVFLDVHRDEKLLGEGLMRDLARRIQALRKELGYVPTDVLAAVCLAELDEESTKLLNPYLDEMKELVRTKKISFQKNRDEVQAKWHEYQIEDTKVYIAILA